MPTGFLVIKHELTYNHKNNEENVYFVLVGDIIPRPLSFNKSIDSITNNTSC